jgi:hypothetical protein
MTLEEEIPHPPAPRLEAVAAGDAPGPMAAHIEACNECRAYVSRLKCEAEAFRARVDPNAFAEGIRERAATSKWRGRVTIVWLASPVAAMAAAWVLWLRAPPRIEGVSTPSTAIVSRVPVGEAARFKGGLSVAAIRERGGRQERLTGPFEVEPFDRIRLEIAVDREEPITAGLLSDDGTWTLLQSPVALRAGTHYSDLAARFDGAPSDAWILVGSPAEVEHARRVRNFEDVVAWRVKSALAR